MLNTDRAYVLIQRLASGSSSGRKGKEVKPSLGRSLGNSTRRFWEDVVVIEQVAAAGVVDIAKATIEEIGSPGETYRVVSLDGPPAELACKARVTVAEIVRQPPPKPAFDDGPEDGFEDEEEDP